VVEVKWLLDRMNEWFDAYPELIICGWITLIAVAWVVAS